MVSNSISSLVDGVLFFVFLLFQFQFLGITYRIEKLMKLYFTSFDSGYFKKIKM